MTTDVRLRWAAAAIYVLAWVLFGLEMFWAPFTASDKSHAKLWIAAVTVGFVLGLLYWHRYRALGWIPMAAVGSFVAVGWAAWFPPWATWNVVLAGFTLGAIIASATQFLRASRLFFLGLTFLAFAFITVGQVILFGGWITVGQKYPEAFRILAAVVAGLIAVLAMYHFFRPWFELMVEPPLWWMFRIRGAGAGLPDFPPHGACIVIANHACWFDPIILAKLLPRPLTPMMTGRFYDLPVISWLMRRFGIIKVIEQSMRRELPELKEAIAALDRGECLVVFPEGYLRRSEERYLKRFGRGLWEILKARPDTPLYSCWIEGNWGSFTSYFKGPPTKHKPRDRRRPIGVGIGAAEVLPAEVLASHLRTRIHLMNRVIEARVPLGLPPLPAFELPSREDDEAEADQSA